MSANISHGRGGAANIRPDDTPYADGEITREGPVGNQGDGPYSAGRGGVGNIDKDGQQQTRVGDEDIVPETATREAPSGKHDNFHYGRGGAGNEIHHAHKQEEPATKVVSQHGFDVKVPDESMKDKIKNVFHKK